MKLLPNDAGQLAEEFLDSVLESPRLDPEIPNVVSTSFVEPADLETFAAGRSFLESMPSSVRRLLPPDMPVTWCIETILSWCERSSSTFSSMQRRPARRSN